MQKFKKLLAIFFAVVLAVTFMPNIPQGTVKAAEAYPSIKEGESVELSSLSEDSYIFKAEKSGRYILSSTSSDETSTSYSTIHIGRANSQGQTAAIGSSLEFKAVAGVRYYISLNNSNSSVTPKGTFSVSRSSLQYTIQSDDEKVNSFPQYLEEGKHTFSVKVTEPESNVSYEWKDNNGNVLSDKADYAFDINDSTMDTDTKSGVCKITNKTTGYSSEVTFSYQGMLHINEVSIGGNVIDNPQAYSYYSVNVESTDNLKVKFDANYLGHKLSYKWTTTSMMQETDLGTTDSPEYTIDNSQRYTDIRCTVTDTKTQKTFGPYSFYINYVHEQIPFDVKAYVNAAEYSLDGNGAYGWYMSVDRGDSVRLAIENVKSSNPESIKYQWQSSEAYKDNYTDISGETKPEFSLKMAKGGVYDYRCIVTDGKDEKIEVQFRINVQSITDIRAMVNGKEAEIDEEDNVSSISASLNDTVNLSVSAKSSAGNLQYTWYNYAGEMDYGNKVNVGEGESISITRETGTLGDIYSCEISDGEDTNYVTFHVSFPEYKVTQKASIDGNVFDGKDFDVTPDSKVVLRIKAESYTGAEITYQWGRDMTQDISGATGSEYEIPAEQLQWGFDSQSQLGYYCKVTVGSETKTYHFYVSVPAFEYSIIKNGEEITGKNSSTVYAEATPKDDIVLRIKIKDGRTYHYQWSLSDSSSYKAEELSGETSSVVELPVRETREGAYSYSCNFTDENGDPPYMYGPGPRNFGIIISNPAVSVTGVSLNPVNLSLETGKTKQLTAEVAPKDATNTKVSWSSSDASVVKVDAEGNVTAVKAGTATITVKTDDGDWTATCLVTVKDPEKKPDTPSTESTATPPATTEVTPPTTQVGVPAGTTVTASKITYQVTSPTSVKLVKNTNKKAKKVTVPATVTINGQTLPVTEIGNNAFKNNKKLTSVVIGPNVTKIGKNVFKGCKSLKKITVKTKKLNSTSIKNLAKSVKFRGAKLTVKVPKAKKKAYKKIFKKSAKKVKIK